MYVTYRPGHVGFCGDIYKGRVGWGRFFDWLGPRGGGRGHHEESEVLPVVHHVGVAPSEVLGACSARNLHVTERAHHASHARVVGLLPLPVGCVLVSCEGGPPPEPRLTHVTRVLLLSRVGDLVVLEQQTAYRMLNHCLWHDFFK